MPWAAGLEEKFQAGPVGGRDLGLWAEGGRALGRNGLEGTCLGKASNLPHRRTLIVKMTEAEKDEWEGTAAETPKLPGLPGLPLPSGVPFQATSSLPRLGPRG